MSKIAIRKVDNEIELEKFLQEIDSCFPIALSKKVNLTEYAKKAMEKGINILAIEDNKIIGVCMGYANDQANRQAYISTIAVLPEYRNMQVGKQLIVEFKKCCKQNNMKSIQLFVHKDNERAIQFYQKMGFEMIGKREDVLKMKMNC